MAQKFKEEEELGGQTSKLKDGGQESENEAQRQAQQAYLAELEEDREGQQGASPQGQAKVPVEDQKIDARDPQGLESYPAVLGKLLGDELQQAVGACVGFGQVAKFAEDALRKAADSFVGQVGKLDEGKIAPQHLGRLGDALLKGLDAQVAAFLGSGPGKALQAILADWKETDPGAIAGAAILAAAGSIVAGESTAGLNSRLHLADRLEPEIESRVRRIQNVLIGQLKGAIDAQGAQIGQRKAPPVEQEAPEQEATEAALEGAAEAPG